MKKQIKIGNNEFKYKKDAIAYYRAILNSYDFGESLNDSHYNDIIDLINYDYNNSTSDYDNSDDNIDLGDITNPEMIENEEDIYICDIKIARVQFNTKCFEIFYSDNTSVYISYLMMINNKGYTAESKFYIACRNSVIDDVRLVKQDYFDRFSIKGQVKCQETGLLSVWTELVVDHRQPNTFSIIVDRFKEKNNIDIDNIDYTTNESNHIIFEDVNLTTQFRNYHKQKAKLRIVRKECNSSRASMARVKQSSKDLTIK